MNGLMTQHLKFNIQWLRAVGCWPLKSTIVNTTLTKLFGFYSKFVLATFILQTICELIEMYFVANKSLNEISFLLGILLFHLIGMIKLRIIKGHRVRKLTNRVLKVEKELFCDQHLNREIIEIYKQHIRQNRLVSLTTIILDVACCLMFCVSPMLMEIMDPPESLQEVINNGSTVIYKPRPLPLKSWFPFNPYKYYTIAYMWHITVVMFVPLLIVSCDNLFFGLIIFAVGQIKILQHNLYRSRGNLLKLKRQIENHKTIVSFVEDLGNTMKNFLLVDFCACGLQVAVLGLQVALEEISFQVLTAAMYLGAMLVQLFLFYWFGNEILSESEKITDTIWNGNWYTCGPAVKKIYLMIIMRSQKPLALSVGPFYRVSTGTMMLIIRTSYSYAALMHRLYSK